MTMNVKSLSTCALSFLAMTAITLSGPTLHDGEAVVDEVVADTDTEAPLRKVAAPIPFENFRYPFVDDGENVLFIGNDHYTFGAKTSGGIYHSDAADGKLTPVVLETDPAPDDGRPMGVILGLQTDRESMVFHRGPDRGLGIYARFAAGETEAIAHRGTKVPGWDHSFDWFWYADIFDNRVVFHGTSNGPEEVISGLYLSEDGSLTRLIDNSMKVHAAGGARLDSFSYQPRMDSEWLVFAASPVANSSDGKSTPGILGWKYSGKAATDFTIQNLQLLAPFGMELPESGGRLMTTANCPVVQDGIVAVVAGSCPEGSASESTQWQSLCIRKTDGEWICPMDTNTRIPFHAAGASFTGFNKWLSIQQGKVIFRGFGPEGYEAIYAYDVDSERLYFVTDNRVLLDGKSIRSFEVGRHSMVGQRLALMIRFADTTSGQYLATMHALPDATPERAPAAVK